MRGALGGEKDQPTVRHGRQNLGPKSERLGVDLTEVVEATEGDESISNRRQRIDFEIPDIHRIRIVTPETVGEASESLGVKIVAEFGWIQIGVGDSPIHGFQTCAAGISAEGRLDGGGLEGEEREAIAGGMAG